MNTMPKDHIVMFPFLSKGHIIPLLHLSKPLTTRGIKVTFITTPANTEFFEEYLQLPQPNVHLRLIPFPSVDSLPESTDKLTSFHLFPAFLKATTLLVEPFRKVMRDMEGEEGLPLCVVSDFFCGWTKDVCDELGVPRLVFHGLSVFSMAVCKALVKHQTHQEYSSSNSEFCVPDLPEKLHLKYSDVPDSIKEVANEVVEFVVASGESELKSWGVLVNSFTELDGFYIPYLEAFFEQAKAWLVGAMCLYSVKNVSPEESCLEWLDRRKPGSVVYVAFGTLVYLPEQQLDEIWHGLEASGYDYLWVVRSPTWVEPTEEGQKDRRGMVIRSWAPQMEVLRHGSVGGFVSHCGWNSVLEAVSCGVPILTWPMVAEQLLNAKYLVEEIGVGMSMGASKGEVVGRVKVCERVRALMGSDNHRKSICEMSEIARVAVQQGGSSYNTMDKLVEELRLARNKKW